jgi:transcriptional regulator with XRE-family HTH domain
MGYYEAGLKQRADLLKQFHDNIQRTDLKIDADFQIMLREAQALLELSDKEMADALSVSRPTINRWMRGKNLPYYAMRKPIVTWISEQLAGKVKKLNTAARQFAAAAAAGVGSSTSSGHEARILVSASR